MDGDGTVEVGDELHVQCPEGKRTVWVIISDIMAWVLALSNPTLTE
jgi:hypothetical protein